MRTPLTACLLLIAVPGLAADPPDKQETPPPHALLKFERKGLKRWITTYELTTVSGATYELRIAYGDRGNMYELYTLNAMLAANWVAGPDRDAGPRRPKGEAGVHVYGVRTNEGKTDRLSSLVVTNLRIFGDGEMTQAEAAGKVRVEAKVDDGKGKPDPERKPRPTGPKIHDDTYVEFDLTTLPAGLKNVFWRFTWEVRTIAGEDEPWIRFTYDIASDGAAENIADIIPMPLTNYGFKTEVVGKTKIRVYGCVWEGSYYPATKGLVVSPDLMKGELPKVTVAGKKS